MSKRTGQKARQREGLRKIVERRANADRMRRLRADRDRKKKCRTCGKPVAVSDRTGKPARLCDGHLQADMLRKLVYILPEQEPDLRRKGVETQLWYPLAWRGQVPS